MRQLLVYNLSLFLLLLTGHGPVWAADAPITDLRVVIDISGSMKETDPDNLRRPALKLLTGLMPEGTHAGVWTFGQYVNMAVPHGRVGNEWKTRARQEADAIHSRGLFTNIESALEKASFNWETPDPAYDRHLLLLTDGKVDVGDDPVADQASRQRILDQLLPRLQKAGVRIHTVGLSDGIDRELLATLSAASDGWYEETRDSEALQRLFLRLFEKAVTVQTLPLTHNRFVVDEQVADITLLVFRRDSDPPLRIETPGQQQWQEMEHPDTTRWYAEAGYDLVTIEQPPQGEWQLHAREDPDNRVMVLTNLRLQTGPLPDHLLAHDRLEIQAWLTDGPQRINDQQFLELVDFTVQTGAVNDAEARPYPLVEAEDDGVADGIYQRQMPPPQPGEHTLRVRASSPTFEREQVHHLRVYAAPLELDLELQSDGDYALRITPVSALFSSESLQLSAHIEAGEAIALTREGPDWRARLPATLAGQTLMIELQATRHDGRDFVSRTERLLGPDSPGTPAPASVPEPTPAPAEQEGEPARELNWKWVIAIVVAINLLLILGGLGIYAYLRKLRRDVLVTEDRELQQL